MVTTLSFCELIVPVVWLEKDQFTPANNLRVTVRIAASKSFSRMIFTPHTCKAIAEPYIHLSIIPLASELSDNRT